MKENTTIIISKSAWTDYRVPLAQNFLSLSNCPMVLYMVAICVKTIACFVKLICKQVYRMHLQLFWSRHYLLLPSPTWAEGTVTFLCLFNSKIFALNPFILKSKTSCKSQNLVIQDKKVVLYKADEFFQESVAQIVFKFENEKK